MLLRMSKQKYIVHTYFSYKKNHLNFSPVSVKFYNNLKAFIQKIAVD
jgi:hypothetical protein